MLNKVHCRGNGATRGRDEIPSIEEVRREAAKSAVSVPTGDDLPLILSTLESASVEEALGLDSNISEVIEAVANGDIKALTGDSPSKRNDADRSAPSVGRGPLKDEERPPAEVRLKQFRCPAFPKLSASSAGTL